MNRRQKSFLRFFFLLWNINILFALNSYGQSKFYSPAESPSKKRIWLVSGVCAYTEIGSFAALYPVWYAQNANATFHFFDDFGNWGNVDKYGHAYSSYQLSRTSGNFYRWAGVSQKKSAIIGLGLGLGYQTTLEIFDGFSNGYGFSWGDMFFNVLGSTIYLTEELAFKQQLFLPKFSYHPTKYAALRPTVLGSNHAQRLLKDYNGQTYWLSCSPKSIMKNSNFPAWLCFSLGYGIDARIVGDQLNYFDNMGTLYESKPQYFLSLDVDFKKLPIKNKRLKSILTTLNYLKIPAPTISITGQKFKFHPIYF